MRLAQRKSGASWLAALGATLVCMLALAGCSTSGAGGSSRVTVSTAGNTSSRGTSPAAAATAATMLSSVAAEDHLDRRAAAGACSTTRVPGWVAKENSRPGAVAQPGPQDDSAVLGYLDRGSVACGGQVAVHLGVAPYAGPTRIWLAAYRIGWYGGLGARLAWRSPTVPVIAQQIPSGVVLPHLVTPAWPVSLNVNVDSSWLPGFYLLIPQDASGTGPAGPAIPLVVRDDGGNEPILFKASTLTWNAYNDWGGWSLYHGPIVDGTASAADRARVVALHRPLIDSGYQQMTLMDLPVIRLAEQLATYRSLDVAYTTDVDVDSDPAQLLHHAEIVSGGHCEYATTGMYDGLQAAAAAGVNLVFLGANNLWWHARLEGGTTGAGATGEPAREVVYRVLAEDPLARTDPSAATVQWQAVPLSRDPAALLGQSHAGIGVHGSFQLLDAPTWYTAGTGLGPGAVIPGAIGNEADGFNPRGNNPAHTQVFAVGMLRGTKGPVLVSTSYSTQPSGAAVFAAGSTDWACAPTGMCADAIVPAATARLVAALTRNVLLALSTPRAGLTHPADPTPQINATTHAPHLNPQAVGSYGGAEPDVSHLAKG